MSVQSRTSDRVPASAGPQRDWRGGRLQLTWVGGERGIPSINADIQNATEATRMTADPDFEIQGTNASTDDVLHNSEGGLTAQTDSADNDQVILVPHQDAGQTPWAQVSWGTDNETRWECFLETPADILTGYHLVAGLKSDLDMGLDDADLVMFNYNTDDSDASWGVVSNVSAGTVADVDSGVRVAPLTRYHFRIELDMNELASCYINDVLVAEVDFGGTAEDLVPILGLQSLSGTTDEVVWYEQKISRRYS